MTWISTDRWTCPGCGHTEHLQVVTAPEQAVVQRLQVQRVHGRAHARQRRAGKPMRRPARAGAQ